MAQELELRPQDRVLVVAPHPDDESIGAGGLLQVAGAVGAAVRVVVLTDGDNNPWPQRWSEKRWRIGAAERARWGARRREEAHAALRVLGVAEDDVRFFGLPDLGLTDLLMRADAALMGSLRQILDEFAPTLVIMPAISDRHPDHNAANVLLRMALSTRGDTPRLLTFAVHGRAAAQGDLVVSLDGQRCRTKQAAILAHVTQMQFSRRRFLAFAGDQERFQSAATPARPKPEHPLQARIEDNRLQVQIDLRRWGKRLHDEVLHSVIDGDQVQRFSLPVGADQAHQRARNAEKIDITIDLAPSKTYRQGFVKLARPEPGWRVFDRFGWQAVVF